MFPGTLSGMLFIMKCCIASFRGRKKTAGDQYIHLHFEKGSGYSRIIQKLSHGREGGFKMKWKIQSEMRE